jgi:hypothetical protein
LRKPSYLDDLLPSSQVKRAAQALLKAFPILITEREIHQHHLPWLGCDSLTVSHPFPKFLLLA